MATVHFIQQGKGGVGKARNAMLPKDAATRENRVSFPSDPIYTIRF